MKIKLPLFAFSAHKLSIQQTLENEQKRAFGEQFSLQTSRTYSTFFNLITGIQIHCLNERKYKSLFGKKKKNQRISQIGIRNGNTVKTPFIATIEYWMFRPLFLGHSKAISASYIAHCFPLFQMVKREEIFLHNTFPMRCFAKSYNLTYCVNQNKTISNY